MQSVALSPQTHEKFDVLIESVNAKVTLRLQTLGAIDRLALLRCMSALLPIGDVRRARLKSPLCANSGHPTTPPRSFAC